MCVVVFVESTTVQHAGHAVAVGRADAFHAFPALWWPVIAVVPFISFISFISFIAVFVIVPVEQPR